MVGLQRGRLLVATPRLRDPNFDRTVVLLLEHSNEGAAGIVINRPSQSAVAGSVPGWDELAGDPAVFFVGGPVSPTGFIGIARWSVPAGAGAVAWAPLLDDIGTVDLAADAREVADSVEEVRLFAGYAGWGPGQLEFEIGEGAWFVVDAQRDDPLSRSPEELWSSVLRRQGGRLALLANYPADPATN